jgi:hypothetical protein
MRLSYQLHLNTWSSIGLRVRDTSICLTGCIFSCFQPRFYTHFSKSAISIDSNYSTHAITQNHEKRKGAWQQLKGMMKKLQNKEECSLESSSSPINVKKDEMIVPSTTRASLIDEPRLSRPLTDEQVIQKVKQIVAHAKGVPVDELSSDWENMPINTPELQVRVRLARIQFMNLVVDVTCLYLV